MTIETESDVELRLATIEVRLDSMVTKEDLARVEARLDNTVTKEDVALLRLEIAELRYQMVRWIVGAVTVASSVGLVGMAILDRLG